MWRSFYLVCRGLQSCDRSFYNESRKRGELRRLGSLPRYLKYLYRLTDAFKGHLAI